MKTAFKPYLKSNSFPISKCHVRLLEKEKSSDDFKFYQKLFALLISFSTILIFPESPRELGNICENYNSRRICKVW
tara:strand:+ start:343 stop:570 length:228 start_codon:yes stop_codon:yes gene_type:complete